MAKPGEEKITGPPVGFDRRLTNCTKESDDEKETL
jgi:hypothetical protein